MSRTREFGAQGQAEPLIAWLNAARKKTKWRKGHERLSRLRELFLAASTLSSAYQNVKSMPESREYPAFVVAAEELREQVNSVLSSYKLQPSIKELRLSAHRWFVGWSARGKGTFETTIPVPGMGGIRYRFGEADAVMRLIELSQSGYLDRVRTCGQCGTWFYAKFAHGRFCKFSCQQESFRNSEDFKRKRREYMRMQRRKESLERRG
jgi:hypothetical protein